MPRVKKPQGGKVLHFPTGEHDLAWDPPDLYTWLQEEPPKKRWFVPGFVVRDGFIIISGQRKLTFKTFTSRALLASLVTGRVIGPFHPDDPARVLFVEEEGSHGENWDAWQAVTRSYEIDPLEYKNRLYWAFRNLIQLNDIEWRRNLVAFVKARQIEVVLFDALFLMVDGDENDSQTMRGVIATLQEIRAAGATIILLAHTNDSKGADPTVDVDLQIRGSGLLKDAYDLHLAARRYTPREPSVLWTVRRRGGEELKYRALWTIKGPKLGAPESVHLEAHEVDTIEGTPESYALKLVSGTYYEKNELAALWGAPAKNLKNLIDSFLRSGILRKENRGFVAVEGDDAEAPDFHKDPNLSHLEEATDDMLDVPSLKFS